MPNVFSGPFRQNDRNTYVNFYHPPPAVKLGSAAVPSTTINTTNVWIADGVYFEQYNTTAAVGTVPTMSTIANNGININNLTQIAAKTVEITQGTSVAQLNAFLVNTSPAFFVRATFNVNTTANVTELYIGFRKIQAYQATMPTGYTDYATIGVHGAAAKLQLQTQAASGGNTITDTTNTITAGQNFTVQVNVSGGGVVTYLKDTAGNGPLIAPTTVAAYTLTSGLTVMPYIVYTTVTSASEVDLVSYSCGLL